MSNGLNIPVIKRLIYKDWHLNRKLIAFYSLGGILGVSMLDMGAWQVYMGSVLFLCMLIALSNHQLANTMINERKEQTLSFVMSLPVSPMDYSLAKLGSNLLMFFIPWLFLLIVDVVFIAVTPAIDGLLPFSIIICVLILVNHCVTWSVGMVTESEPVILVVMIALNCLINPAIYVLARLPGITEHMQNVAPVWTPTALGLLLAEFLLVVGCMSLAVYLQARKKVFY